MKHEIYWSRWTPYESSFSLALLPHSPGVFAVAEEITSLTDAKRMLALVSVTEAADLAYILGHLHQFSPEVQKRLGGSPLYVRFAVIDDSVERAEVVLALQNWMREAAATASGIVENFAAQPTLMSNDDDAREKRDEVLEPMFPAGF